MSYPLVNSHCRIEIRCFNMYHCRTCFKEFKTKSGWVKHELAHNVTYKCDTCGIRYRRACSLKQHLRRTGHSDVRRRTTTFRCSSCVQEFATARQLLLHNDQVHRHHDQRGGASQTAFNGAAEVKTLRPVGTDKFDLVNFLSSARPAIEKYLLSKVRRHALKWYIVAQVELTRETAEGEIRTAQPFFRSVAYTLLTADNFDQTDLNSALQKLVVGLEKYIHESSGWILREVMLLNIHTALYKPLAASSFIDLPTTLKQCGTLLNIKNADNKCFLWCLIAACYGFNENPETVNQYLPYENHFDMSDIPYPVSLASLDRFERQNNNISVNVFGFENKEIYPLRITKQKGKHHVNLLFLQEGTLTHYCLIKDLNRFLSRTKRHRTRAYFCPYCLNALTRKDLLDEHVEYCSIHGEQKLILPEKGQNDILKFSDFRKQMMCPFIIYCDFETLNRDIASCHPDPAKSSTTATKLLDVCSYGYKRICTVDDRYTKSTVIFRGPNAAQHFVESLLREEEEIKEILSRVEPLKMTDEEYSEYAQATTCFICECEFDQDGANRVLDHCHVSGRYRGAACESCNLNFQINSFIPVFFHGFRNFDSHIICQAIGEYEKNRRGITCIPQIWSATQVSV